MLLGTIDISILDLNISVAWLIVFLISVAIFLLVIYFIILFFWSKSKRIVKQKKAVVAFNNNKIFENKIIFFEKELNLVKKIVDKLDSD